MGRLCIALNSRCFITLHSPLSPLQLGATMKLSGFTIERNVVRNDYPVLEATNSILPVCDEVVVAVGKSEDETLNLVQSINSPKIKIIETVWDESLRTGGKVLADETNKAFAAVDPNSD